MRGKVKEAGGQNCKYGITPAHAGKSVFWLYLAMRRRDHPRACGEKYPIYYDVEYEPGSPPRMRGKGHRQLSGGRFAGITPAHAGKRSPPWRFSFPNGGSPPRMRGKDRSPYSTGSGQGITPAHAGKSNCCTKSEHTCRDHPRACGEKTKKIPYYRLFPLRSAPFSFSFA